MRNFCRCGSLEIQSLIRERRRSALTALTCGERGASVPRPWLLSLQPSCVSGQSLPVPLSHSPHPSSRHWCYSLSWPGPRWRRQTDSRLLMIFASSAIWERVRACSAAANSNTFNIGKAETTFVAALNLDRSSRTWPILEKPRPNSGRGKAAGERSRRYVNAAKKVIRDSGNGRSPRMGY